MVRVKRSESPNQKPVRKTTRNSPRFGGRVKGGQEIPLSENIWDGVVKELIGRRFKSWEEGRDAVIQCVISELKLKDEFEDETKRFLRDLLDTDPGMKTDLKKLLKIG